MGIDVTKQHFISCKNFDFSVGTWTYSNNGGLPKQLKTAADETIFISLLINIPKRTNQYGIKINNIILPYTAATVDLDAPITAVLYQASWMQNLAVGSPLATIPRTNLSTTVSAVTTANAGTQCAIATPNTVQFENIIGAVNTQNYTCSFSFNAGATTVLTVYDAIVNYEEVES